MRRPSAVAAVLVVALASCGRCTRDPAAAPERHLPPARFAVVIPDISAAQRDWRAVLATVSRFPAAAGLPDWLTALRAQLGFDPLTAGGIESAGIDPDGGAAYAETAEGPMVVLPIGDAAAFEATVARLARDRIGATHRSESSRGAAHVSALSRGAGDPVEVAYAIAGRVAVLARGPGAVDAVAHAATLAPDGTLEASPAWRAAREALGRGHVMVAFRGPGAPQEGSTLAAIGRDGAALGLSGKADRVQGRAVLLLSPERQPAWREIATPVAKASGDDLARLPRDAFAVARFAGDPVPLARRALWAFPEVARLLGRAGLDVERDVLPAIAPGAALAVSLAPTFDVTSVSRGGRDGALGDPFRSFHVTAFTRITSRERAVAAVEALAAAARRSGAGVSASAEPPSWSFTSGGARLDVAIAEDRLLVAGGPQRVSELAERLRDGAGWSAPTSGIRGLAAGGAGAAVIDFGNLVRSARALPSAAYGTGPDAFVMRSIADRVLDPASRLEVAGVRVDLGDGAVRADFVVEAREDAEPRP